MPGVSSLKLPSHDLITAIKFKPLPLVLLHAEVIQLKSISE